MALGFLALSGPIPSCCSAGYGLYGDSLAFDKFLIQIRGPGAKISSLSGFRINGLYLARSAFRDWDGYPRLFAGERARSNLAVSLLLIEQFEGLVAKKPEYDPAAQADDKVRHGPFGIGRYKTAKPKANQEKQY